MRYRNVGSTFRSLILSNLLAGVALFAEKANGFPDLCTKHVSAYVFLLFSNCHTFLLFRPSSNLYQRPGFLRYRLFYLSLLKFCVSVFEETFSHTIKGVAACSVLIQYHSITHRSTPMTSGILTPYEHFLRNNCTK